MSDDATETGAETRRPRACGCRRCSRTPASPRAASPRTSSSTGRVRVNGDVVTELGSRIDPEVDLVDVDGTAIQLDQTKRYVMLNKPTGVVSSMQRRPRPARSAAVHEGLARAPLQRRPTGCRDQRSARAHERRRARPRARAPVVRRDEGLHRQGRGARDRADHRDAHARDRPRGRPDRRRQGAAAVELGGRRRLARRADPALRAQPHRAAHDGRGRASGRRARAAPVRAAAPGNPPSRAGTRVD